MKTIAMTGGKGGVGKSLLSANLAVALARRGKRVVLFDADLQLANLDVMLGIQAPSHLQHVVFGEKSLSEVLVEGPAGVRVATGGSALNGLMNAGPKRLAVFMAEIEKLTATTDFLIFDTGSGIDTRVMTFLRFAQEVVMVTTPDPTSVTDAYATIKTLLKKEPQAQVSVLTNQVRSEDEATRVFGSLNGICKQFLGRSVNLLGYVRADMEAMTSVRRRLPFVISAPSCSASVDVDRVAANLLQKPKFTLGGLVA